MTGKEDVPYIAPEISDLAAKLPILLHMIEKTDDEEISHALNNLFINSYDKSEIPLADMTLSEPDKVLKEIHEHSVHMLNTPFLID